MLVEGAVVALLYNCWPVSVPWIKNHDNDDDDDYGDGDDDEDGDGDGDGVGDGVGDDGDVNYGHLLPSPAWPASKMLLSLKMLPV